MSILTARRSFQDGAPSNSANTNTWGTLALAGDAASLTYIVIPANTTWTYSIHVSVRGTEGGAGGEISAGYKIEGVIERDGSNNTALVGSPTYTVLAEDDADWDVRVSADDTNEALWVEVYIDENQARAVAKITLVECGG